MSTVVFHTVYTKRLMACRPSVIQLDDSTAHHGQVLRQSDILFDGAAYSAFPHVVRLAGDELLLSLRQAPIGLGRIAALYHCSSTLYWNREHIRCLDF